MFISGGSFFARSLKDLYKSEKLKNLNIFIAFRLRTKCSTRNPHCPFFDLPVCQNSCMSVTFPCSSNRSSERSKCRNLGTDVILAHEQLVVLKRNLYMIMTSQNEKKIIEKMTKDSSLFSCVFEDQLNIDFGFSALRDFEDSQLSAQMSYSNSENRFV